MGGTVIRAANDGDGTERSRSTNHAVGTVSRAISNGVGTDIIRSAIHADGNEIGEIIRSTNQADELNVELQIMRRGLIQLDPQVIQMLP